MASEHILSQSQRYNNIGPVSSFITEIQHISQQALLSEKEFFPGICHTCGAMPSVTGVCVQRCAGCQLVSYCNKNCQKADWKIHKIMCKKFPVEMGKNIIVRKTENLVDIDCTKFSAAMYETYTSVSGTLNGYAGYVSNIFMNLRVCSICYEARSEMLFDCRCCAISYCSEAHRKMDQDKFHCSKQCDILYDCAMANWYRRQHHQLLIPNGLLNEVSLNDGLEFERVSKLATFSSEKWLKTKVNLINEYLTFPLTIYHALKNLTVKLGEQMQELSELTSLTIHIVHNTPMLDPRMWEYLLHQLPNLKTLNLAFIYRDLKLDTPFNSFLPLERCSDCERKQRVINYSIHPMQYHEYFSSDDYVEPDVVVVFGTSGLRVYEMRLEGDTIYGAQCFASHGNMTYCEHTVVILTDHRKDWLEDYVKSFHDARPVIMLLPIQENPAAGFTTNRTLHTVINQTQLFCCLQGNHGNYY